MQLEFHIYEFQLMSSDTKRSQTRTHMLNNPSHTNRHKTKLPKKPANPNLSNPTSSIQPQILSKSTCNTNPSLSFTGKDELARVAFMKKEKNTKKPESQNFPDDSAETFLVNQLFLCAYATAMHCMHDFGFAHLYRNSFQLFQSRFDGCADPCSDLIALLPRNHLNPMR